MRLRPKQSGRTYVIGDIHGCLDEVDRLLDAIAPGAADRLCFLGDYVDRGPSSRGVIDRLLSLSGEGPQCTFLKGNHEDMFLDFLGYGGHHGQAFLWNGGEITLASYGIEGLTGAAAAAGLPPEHLSFLRNLETTARFGQFLCVHAGLRPTRTLEEQSEEDLYWIREEFITAPHEFPFVILYGHTPQREIRMNLPFHIGLDTGVVYGNRLSCLDLSNRELLQIRRSGTEVERTSLAADFDKFGIGTA